MIPVIIESPYAGDILTHVNYLRAAMRDCLMRDEAPYASHALYTQPGILRDGVLEERVLGIRAGFVWRSLVKKTVVYTDYGISKGMELGIINAGKHEHEIEFRKLGKWIVTAYPVWP